MDKIGQYLRFSHSHYRVGARLERTPTAFKTIEKVDQRLLWNSTRIVALSGPVHVLGCTVLVRRQVACPTSWRIAFV